MQDEDTHAAEVSNLMSNAGKQCTAMGAIWGPMGESRFLRVVSGISFAGGASFRRRGPQCPRVGVACQVVESSFLLTAFLMLETSGCSKILPAACMYLLSIVIHQPQGMSLKIGIEHRPVTMRNSWGPWLCVGAGRRSNYSHSRLPCQSSTLT